MASAALTATGATKVTVPTETITEGLQRIDGVTYDFKRFVDAESDLQLAAPA